jgi:hypothetical protein
VKNTRIRDRSIQIEYWRRRQGTRVMTQGPAVIQERVMYNFTKSIFPHSSIPLFRYFRYLRHSVIPFMFRSVYVPSCQLSYLHYLSPLESGRILHGSCCILIVHNILHSYLLSYSCLVTPSTSVIVIRLRTSPLLSYDISAPWGTDIPVRPYCSVPYINPTNL